MLQQQKICYILQKFQNYRIFIQDPDQEVRTSLIRNLGYGRKKVRIRNIGVHMDHPTRTPTPTPTKFAQSC